MSEEESKYLINPRLTLQQTAKIKLEQAFKDGLISEYKECSRCEKSKRYTEFRLRKLGGDNIGLRCECNDCYREYIRTKRNSKTKEQKDIDAARNKKWRSENFNLMRKSNIEKTYGMDVLKYNELLIDQEFCCAICGIHQSEMSRVLAVDHDHETNEIRGLLCTTCNTGLGQFQDDVEVLKKAIHYLNKYKQ